MTPEQTKALHDAERVFSASKIRVVIEKYFLENKAYPKSEYLCSIDIISGKDGLGCHMESRRKCLDFVIK
ncbi:MAG: hypothetical protein HYW88_02285 [Candidatus Sungbacteria bacterium]|nr:hypothetical protein [Candidatus Sungbacteria bacterium]